MQWVIVELNCVCLQNQMYYEAIRMAVASMHEQGKLAHVLDIGTGTGLLSMMAARCGADTIFACEVCVLFLAIECNLW
jgi:predicted RNA methylase